MIKCILDKDVMSDAIGVDVSQKGVVELSFLDSVSNDKNVDLLFIVDNGYIDYLAKKNKIKDCVKQIINELDSKVFSDRIKFMNFGSQSNWTVINDANEPLESSLVPIDFDKRGHGKSIAVLMNRIFQACRKWKKENSDKKRILKIIFCLDGLDLTKNKDIREKVQLGAKKFYEDKFVFDCLIVSAADYIDNTALNELREVFVAPNLSNGHDRFFKRFITSLRTPTSFGIDIHLHNDVKVCHIITGDKEIYLPSGGFYMFNDPFFKIQFNYRPSQEKISLINKLDIYFQGGFVSEENIAEVKFLQVGAKKITYNYHEAEAKLEVRQKTKMKKAQEARIRDDVISIFDKDEEDLELSDMEQFLKECQTLMDLKVKELEAKIKKKKFDRLRRSQSKKIGGKT